MTNSTYRQINGVIEHGNFIMKARVAGAQHLTEFKEGSNVGRSQRIGCGQISGEKGDIDGSRYQSRVVRSTGTR
jgi:hypothetical protein